MVAFENRSAMYFQHSPEKLQTFRIGLCVKERYMSTGSGERRNLQTLRGEIQPAFTRRQANPPSSGTEPRPG